MQRAPRIIVGFTILALGAGGAWYGLTRGNDGTILVSGTVEATEADLGFQVSGKLEQVTAREGDMVTPGLELATLERSEPLAERAVALAQVVAAQALLDEMLAGSRAEEIARARADLSVAVDRRDAAHRDLNRLASLAEKALISRQEFDHQQTAADVADGDVARATQELQLLTAGTRPERIAAQRATLAQATASLERIDAVLAQSMVTAPFAGTVTIRHREPGEAVSPGAAVLTLQNLADRWVRIYVPGDEVGRLSLGECATIASDGFTDRRYNGVISYISRVAEFTPRNVQSTRDRVRLVYEVRVRIVGDDAIDLKPGLPGDVTFAANATSGTTTAQASCNTPAAVALGSR
jgi:HlyD family secretion protein